MQEEVEQRTLTLTINTAKLTGRVLKNAIAKFLAYQKQKSRNGPVKHNGKQTVKQLIGQNQGVSSIEVSKSGIRDFQRVARKYGVDYAIRKDTSGEKPRYIVFFKARDSEALMAAFKEYTAKSVRKNEKKKQRQSVLAKLHKLIKQSRDAGKEKTPELSLLPEHRERMQKERALLPPHSRGVER